MELRPITISKKELERIRKNEIGHGTDGTVFRYKNGYLIKLYHEFLKTIDADFQYKISQNSSDDDIKIYNMHQKTKVNYEPMINYIDTDETKLYGENALKQAIARQSLIKSTNLPQNIVYIDGRFGGCLLKESRGIQIHKLSGMSLNYRRQIMINVLKAFKELLDNHIYAHDIDNSPFANTTIINKNGKVENVGHSHILVNPLTKKINIIDLEGKSATYTEKRSEICERKALMSLTSLILEFFLDISADECDYNFGSDDLDYLLSEREVQDEYIKAICEYELSFKQAEDLILSYKK